MADILKICIFGPESTGKSTLAAHLAHHYRTCFVPEFAKSWIEKQGGKISYEDISIIAKGQIKQEAHYLKKAQRLFFCDTDIITTVIWSHWLFGKCPAWITEAARKSQYDLYLLMDVDVPWVYDLHRFLPKERDVFFKKCEEALNTRGINYIKIAGNWSHRFDLAKKTIDDLLKRVKKCP